MPNLEVGTVVLIDKDNKKYQQKVNGSCIGVITSINPRKSFFTSTTYDVYVPDLDITLDSVLPTAIQDVRELEEFKKATELTVIRNPVDLPEFNIHDKIALAGAIKYFDGELDKDTNMTGINNQLKKMLRKLEFYEGMRDV